MDEPEKLQTTLISSADLRRRATILRQIATLFDGIAAQMDENCIAPIQMKGAATFERAIVFLRGSVNTAQSAVLEKMTEMPVDLLVEETEKAAEQIVEKVKPPKKGKR